MTEIIPGYFIHTPDEKFGPYANIMEADTAAEKLMSEGVQVIGITKEGFEGVVSYEALEYSAESHSAEGLFCPSCKDNTRMDEDEEWCHLCEASYEAESFRGENLAPNPCIKCGDRKGLQIGPYKGQAVCYDCFPHVLTLSCHKCSEEKTANTLCANCRTCEECADLQEGECCRMGWDEGNEIWNTVDYWKYVQDDERGVQGNLFAESFGADWHKKPYALELDEEPDSQYIRDLTVLSKENPLYDDFQQGFIDLDEVDVWRNYYRIAFVSSVGDDITAKQAKEFKDYLEKYVMKNKPPHYKLSIYLPSGPIENYAIYRAESDSEIFEARGTWNLYKSQEKLLKAYRDSGGKENDYDSLPIQIVNKLENIRNSETLWSDVNRWLRDNPSTNKNPYGGFHSSWDAESFFSETVMIAGKKNDKMYSVAHIKGMQDKEGFTPEAIIGGNEELDNPLYAKIVEDGAKKGLYENHAESFRRPKLGSAYGRGDWKDPDCISCGLSPANFPVNVNGVRFELIDGLCPNCIFKSKPSASNKLRRFSAETKSDGEEYEYFDDFSDLEGYTQGPWFSHPMIGMSIGGIKGGGEYGESVGHSNQDLRLLLSAPELFEELKACKDRFSAESFAAEESDGDYCESCDTTKVLSDDDGYLCHECGALTCDQCGSGDVRKYPYCLSCIVQREEDEAESFSAEMPGNPVRKYEKTALQRHNFDAFKRQSDLLSEETQKLYEILATSKSVAESEAIKRAITEVYNAIDILHGGYWDYGTDAHSAESSVRKGMMGNTAYRWYVDGDESIQDRNGEPLIRPYDEEEIDEDIQHNIKMLVESGVKTGREYHAIDDSHDRFDEPQSYGIFYSWYAGAESFSAESLKGRWKDGTTRDIYGVSVTKEPASERYEGEKPYYRATYKGISCRIFYEGSVLYRPCWVFKDGRRESSCFISPMEAIMGFKAKVESDMAAESKLPPAEKAGITGVISGATMEGLETLLAAEDDALPEHIKTELRQKHGITQKETRLIKRLRLPPRTQRGTPREPRHYQDYDLTSVTPVGWTHREAETLLAADNSEAGWKVGQCPSCHEMKPLIHGDEVCEDCEYCDYCDEYHPWEIRQICYEEAFSKHYEGPAEDAEYHTETEELAEVRTELSKSRTGMSLIRTGLAIGGFILLWEHHKWAKEEHDTKENTV